LSPHRVGRTIRDPLLPRWFTTYRPRNPVAPNTVDVIPLRDVAIGFRVRGFGLRGRRDARRARGMDGRWDAAAVGGGGGGREGSIAGSIGRSIRLG
jgi:hypothetical protein